MLPVPPSKPLFVLVAEDDENDLVLLQGGLARSGLPLRLIIAHDGQEAIDYLSGRPLPRQADPAVTPDLLLLDITMPRCSGFEVLRWLGARPEWRRLPSVILSYSMLASDKNTARLLGATDYLNKPRTVEGMAAMLQD